MLFAALTRFGAPAKAQQSDDDNRASDRVVHLFDFDEREAGNLEDIPMFWTPLRPAGFPQFAAGSFDFEVGATAPPSFYLNCNGRNVAYQYAGPDIRVRINSEYRIEFAIRPDNLHRARTCVSAYFVDKQGDPILRTMARSRFVGGADEPEGWSRPSLTLPAAPLNAETIGLAVWVLQEPQWRDSVPEARHIPRVDIRSGVWVDDIVVRTLPRVELSTSTPGNVLTDELPQHIRVLLADTGKNDLRGRLSIRAADGGLVQSISIEVAVDEFVEPTMISVDHLLPGFYRAILEVHAGETLLAERQLSFAMLANLGTDDAANARSFGLVIDPRTRSNPESELVLLRNQLVRSVKLPIWTGLVEDRLPSLRRRDADRMYQALMTGGFVVTGVFFGAPSAIVLRDGRYPRALIDLLSDQPDAWEEYLAAAAVPYASVVRWWQVGADAGPKPVNRKKIVSAVSQLRTAMKHFISAPLLVLPESSTTGSFDETIPVEQVSLNIEPEIPLEWIGRLLEEKRKEGYGHVTAYIESLPADRFRRLPRLADWAQRLITASFEGADTVFVPQTWRVRDTAHGTVTEPTEEYLILRTLAGLIRDAVPGRRFTISHGVECLAFYDGQEAVLAMWDHNSPSAGREYAIQLGKANRQYDLWGRSKELAHDADGRQLVRLSPLPVIVTNIEKWLIDFRTALSIRPNHIESGSEVSDHTIEMVHIGSTPVSGEMTLAAPPSWKITPRSLSFNLMPQRTEHLSIRTTYPHNEVAAVKKFVAKVRLVSEPYYLEIPLPIELGLSNVTVSGMAVNDGADLILRHTVTNRTNEVLHFRSAAQVPGRQRQYRPFSNLRPGDTQTVEYRFTSAVGLVGSTVRLGLREMNDGSRTHALELVVP